MLMITSRASIYSQYPRLDLICWNSVNAQYAQMG